LGPLLLLIYINDLPLALNKISTPILFADDTSIIITESDSLIFHNKLNEVFKILNTWFNNNLLSLNHSKTEYIIFSAKRCHDLDNGINIAYEIQATLNSWVFTLLMHYLGRNTLISLFQNPAVLVMRLEL
jgi:hypothetical protein